MAKKRNKTPSQASWRPNFRNPETLPDIKVIRTDFLLTVATVSIVVMLLGLLAYREYRIVSLSRALASTEENIAANIAADRSSVRLSNEFRRTETAVKEAIQFLNVPVDADDLVYAVAEVQPREVVLSSISFSPSVARQGRREIVSYQLVLNGTVSDANGRSATDIITEYRNAFGEMELLEPYFSSSELSGFSRNDALGLFNFTIRVMLTLEPRTEA